MAVKCTGEDRVLTAQVSGEVDHHGAREIMGELERNIETSLPRVLELDLGGVTFMDSSALPYCCGLTAVWARWGARYACTTSPPRRPVSCGRRGWTSSSAFRAGLPGRLGIPIFAITVGAAGSGPHGRFLYI